MLFHPQTSSYLLSQLFVTHLGVALLFVLFFHFWFRKNKKKKYIVSLFLVCLSIVCFTLLLLANANIMYISQTHAHIYTQSHIFSSMLSYPQVKGLGWPDEESRDFWFYFWFYFWYSNCLDCSYRELVDLLVFGEKDISWEE